MDTNIFSTKDTTDTTNVTEEQKTFSPSSTITSSDPLSLHFSPSCTPEPPSSSSRKSRNFFLVVFILIIASASLGVGVGIGNAVGQNFATEEIVVEPVETNITTVHLRPNTVQINPDEPSIADIIPLVKDAVVSISVLSGQSLPFGIQSPGSGSGFIFYEDDDSVFIATNNHVIENATRITISLDDNENVEAQIVGTDPSSDLAVLSVSKADLAEKGVPHTVAMFGDSDIMRMGDTVLAIGNAMGEGQTVTKGIVSAMNLTITVGDLGMRNRLTLDVMQTDAAVNRGNSGGPLLNHRGEVIGVVTAKMMGSDIEGMGYALPINEAGAILFQLKETGQVRHPFVGIRHEEFTEFMRSLFNMPYTGLLIRDVVPNSPAEAAGILVDDLIVYFNDVRMYSMAEFVTELGHVRPGDEVTVVVFRGGELVELQLILGVLQH